MTDITSCVLTPKVPTDGFDALGVGVHRASTIVFANASEYAERGKRGPDGYSYGLYERRRPERSKRSLAFWSAPREHF